MSRFGKLQDVDGHGVYLSIYEVVGLLPIRSEYTDAFEKEEKLYEAGARAWIVTSGGFMHASFATVEEIRQRIGELEADQ